MTGTTDKIQCEARFKWLEERYGPANALVPPHPSPQPAFTSSRAAKPLAPRNLQVMIQHQAIVSPQAELGRDVNIGPFCIVEPDVVIGDGCRLASHVVVKQGTRMGNRNHIHEGAVIGGLPQHLQMPDRPGRLIIGDNNIIREFCTVHRSLHENEATRMGNNSLLMVGSHVAHDCQLDDEVILTNSVLLGGHVTVGNRAYLAGAAAVHQFCRIGHNAMVGGQARIVKDVPPYVTIDGTTSLIVGLNLVGLRRAAYQPDQISQLKSAYRLIYRRGLTWREVLETLLVEFPDGPAAEFYRFFAGGTRGFIPERRTPPSATIKLHRVGGIDPAETRRVG